ncbi:hypothetical protein LCGC14_0967130 [marine sediment metagenome]|uniref:Uncharacterized protein n=1 Tax=marine sediment metagenome TaxID=412755 RepID=A0A0F9NH80_9ZZZZ
MTFLTIAVIGIVALAYWRGNVNVGGFIFLHMMAGGTLIAYGLALRPALDSNAGLVVSLAVLGLGAYSLFRAIESIVNLIQGRK